MLNFYLALIFILLLLIFVWWILRNRKIPWIRLPSKELHHIEGLYLSMNTSIHLIKYKDRYFLIGCSPGGMTLLKEMEVEKYEK